MTVVDPARPGYDAVLLAGFGGPEGPADVMPFLRNVTRGRGVPEQRLVEVSEHYRALGGVSPINEQNRRLRAALEGALAERGVGLPVLWGNRNWSPYLRDVLVEAHRAGQVRLLGVATSAYSSYSSCRQYREDFGMALAATGLVGAVRIDKVRPYFGAFGFVQPFVDGAVGAFRSALDAGLTASNIEIVFTTHSLPRAMADASGSDDFGEHGSGGGYVAQHLAVAETVVKGIAEAMGVGPAWQLAYQSRSGPPQVPWLGPDVSDVISGLAAAGRRGVIIVPIGFVSDHMEVIWDLDREAAHTAAELGLWFARVDTPGTDPRFVQALADLVVERLSEGPGREVVDPDAGAAPPGVSRTSGPAGRFVVDGAARPDFCPAGCCVNPAARFVRPTTAAVDSADDWRDVAGEHPDLTARLARSGIPGTLRR